MAGQSSPADVEAYPRVEDSPLERCPRVGRPPPAFAARRTHERVVLSHARAAEVLQVAEDARPPEAALGDRAEHHVGHALGAVRVLLERLTPRVVDLEPDAALAFLFPD